jgi:epoxyqueuosine reductase
LGRDGDGAPVIDARRCISYLTIELRGAIPLELRRPIGNRVFGCDICQEVCPWNESFAHESEEIAYRVRSDLDGPALVDLARRLVDMDEDDFRESFRTSPVRRTGRAGLLRNVCVALGNERRAEAVPVLSAALSDPDPLVRSHAAWALGEVDVPAAKEALANRGLMELDGPVQEAIADALRGPGIA